MVHKTVADTRSGPKCPNEERCIGCLKVHEANSGPAAAKQSTQAVVESVVQWTLGTVVEPSAALMSAGLDSLSVAGLVSTLSAELKMDIAPTDLFDHPTLDSMVSYLSTLSAGNAPAGRASCPDDARPASREVSNVAKGERGTVLIAA